MEILKNEFVRVTVDSDMKCINYYDLKDLANETRGFTRNVRGIKRAVEYIKNLNQEQIDAMGGVITFGKVSDILWDFKLKPHTYCGVD